ncbi:MAG: hypothetical protein KC583_15985, partial [Myxococcales bacterium]|nr:hypothetical protein [Myxococcales bacterium]
MASITAEPSCGRPPAWFSQATTGASTCAAASRPGPTTPGRPVGAPARVVTTKADGRIIGASILGHGAQEVIHLFAFAIAHGLEKSELSSAVYAYP